MSIPILQSSAKEFPDFERVFDDGIVAFGGNLSTEFLLSAYNKGVFPWFNEGEPITWWCPVNRMVLPVSALKVSKSMRKVLREKQFKITVNQAFDQVILNCAEVPRKGQDGTWITAEILQAYIELNKLGFAHSVEVWQNNQLVGGLYGLLNKSIFFGESMFSKASNASKAGFITFTKFLQANGVLLIDCQVYNDHLATFGAYEIPIGEYLGALPHLIQKPTLPVKDLAHKFDLFLNEESTN